VPGKNEEQSDYTPLCELLQPNLLSRLKIAGLKGLLAI